MAETFSCTLAFRSSYFSNTLGKIFMVLPMMSTRHTDRNSSAHT